MKTIIAVISHLKDKQKLIGIEENYFEQEFYQSKEFDDVKIVLFSDNLDITKIDDLSSLGEDCFIIHHTLEKQEGIGVNGYIETLQKKGRAYRDMHEEHNSFYTKIIELFKKDNNEGNSDTLKTNANRLYIEINNKLAPKTLKLLSAKLKLLYELLNKPEKISLDDDKLLQEECEADKNLGDAFDKWDESKKEISDLSELRDAMLIDVE